MAHVVKRYGKLAGIEPSTIAGHSLRSGPLTTAAARPDANILAIAQHARHKNPAVPMSDIQTANQFKAHPLEGLT